jgi:hypothetical protein
MTPMYILICNYFETSPLTMVALLASHILLSNESNLFIFQNLFLLTGIEFFTQVETLVLLYLLLTLVYTILK